MKKSFYTLLLLISIIDIYGQQSSLRFNVEGKIIDNKNVAISLANVFLEGTTLGIQSDVEGKFVVKNVPVGKYRLVASMIGYQAYFEPITISNKNILVNITLRENTKALDEVKVVAGKDKRWEKQIKEFEYEFLGSTFNKKEVQILNREVVSFEYNKDEAILKAKANQAIIIENRTLGYKIHYILKDFEKKKELSSHSGISRYEKLKPIDEKEALRWKKNQVVAYKGSATHFFKALLDNKLVEEGFDAFFLNPNYVNNESQKLIFYGLSGTRHFDIKPQEIIQLVGDDSDLYMLRWTYPIEVVYNKIRTISFVFSDAPYPYSILIPKNGVVITKNGNLYNPCSVEMQGEMSKAGFANSLPLDYNASEEN